MSVPGPRRVEHSTSARRRPGPRSGDFDERHRARLLEIVDLAAELFARQGYASTSVDEIGVAAGLGRGALYHYIGSKANLLTEIHGRFMRPLLGMIRVCVELDVSWSAKLVVVAERHLEIQVRMLDHSRVVLQEFRHLPPDQDRVFRAARDEYEAGWGTILEGGRAAGEFVMEDVGLTRLAILGMLNYTVQWVSPSGPLSAVEIARRYCELILGGIVPGVDWARLDREVAGVMPLITEHAPTTVAL